MRGPTARKAVSPPRGDCPRFLVMILDWGNPTKGFGTSAKTSEFANQVDPESVEM